MNIKKSNLKIHPVTSVKQTIGGGSMGSHHARVYSEISNLVAVSESNEKVWRSVAEKLGINWYADYRDMLKEVDAVSITVPTIYHREVAEIVSQAGVNFLVEKPISNTLEDAQAIVSAAERANIKMAVGHIERYNPVLTSTINILKKKKAEILTLFAQRLSLLPQRITDVGVVFDLTIHDIDIICHLADSEIHSLYCSGGSVNKGHEDFINLILNFNNGVRAICETNWISSTKKRQLEIKTNDAIYSLDFINQELNLINSDANSPTDSFKVEKNEPLKIELLDFLESIESDSRPFVTGEHGIRAVKIAEAALYSMKLDKVIKL